MLKKSSSELTILVTPLRHNRSFSLYAAFLGHSYLISPPQWLIDMRWCATISPDEKIIVQS